jgi:hypothetical protein
VEPLQRKGRFLSLVLQGFADSTFFAGAGATWGPESPIVKPLSLGSNNGEFAIVECDDMFHEYLPTGGCG